MITNVIPEIINKAVELDGERHLGLTTPLTSFQTQAKKSWLSLATRSSSGKDYGTDIQRWTCRCGTQELQAQHLCKHLVQAVQARGPLPPNFFGNLSRRRTIPIYRLAHIRDGGSEIEGSITDGDDVWMDSRKQLSKGAWRTCLTSNLMSKRSRSPSCDHMCNEPPNKKPQIVVLDLSSSIGSDASYESEDEETISKKKEISQLIEDLVCATEILTKQSELGSSKWAKSITSTPLFTSVAPALRNYVQTIALHEASPGRTWPKNSQEKRQSMYTLYHQI